MPRPTPADLALVLLAAAVLTGAVRVATQDPSPPTTPVALTASPTASPTATPTVAPTPTPTATPTATPTPAGTTAKRAARGTVLLVGTDLVALAEPLGPLGWDVLVGEPGDPAVLAEGVLEGLTATPTLVVLQVEPGTRTSERVTEATGQVAAAFPGAVIVLVGPFDPEASRTTAAVEQAALEHGVLFLDPVALGWSEGAEAGTVAGELDETLAAALNAGD